ncbi:protein transport protein Sec61 subunit alpha-like [Selaginella moellendorffii]|uniref:protein transport protein Sec61 subunit alpha-like n=1 Tax=Selaginella moellendorffii TaxID=88036 RepID=UPI000D1D0FB0|nr:protein transport protein Sec61 subunit alpha-like [Selaginella moellendorffii]|eukprot:XP_024540736.1 protein transport protein Sec61 subunit alpha-like [Selaginella moellendorffii]
MALSKMKGFADRLFTGATRLLNMEIDRPKLPIPLEQRLLNTGLCVSLLIVSSRLPVFGITKSLSENPYQLLTNSSHGTLMELGIAPLITTNMAVQVMAGGKILSFKDTKSMKMVQKVGGLFLTLVLATMNVAGGIELDMAFVQSRHRQLSRAS